MYGKWHHGKGGYGIMGQCGMRDKMLDTGDGITGQEMKTGYAGGCPI